MKLSDYLIQYNEDSVKELDNPALVDRIVEFIRKNPFPKDHEQFHKWTKSLGYDESDKVEEYVYAILTVILCGGASKGKEIKASDRNKLIGDQIELEHVEMDNDNEVIKRIQMVFQNKIRNDHLAENKEYYMKNLIEHPH